MTGTGDQNKADTYLSEVFLLRISEPKLMAFRLTPEIAQKDGNRLSYHFSRNLPEIVVTWQKPYFWILASSNRQLPSEYELKEALVNIQDEVEDYCDRFFSFDCVSYPQETPSILAQLAIQVLNKTQFSDAVISSEKGIEVRREPDFWPETIEIKRNLQPALTLTVHSRIVFRQNLADFYENHPDRQKPEKLLIGLKVQEVESKSNATIISLVGTMAEHREKLLKKATSSTSKQALRDAPNDQPVVAVQFGKNPQQYDYAMAALSPCITSETAKQFEVDYRKLLNATKMNPQERASLLASYKKPAADTLASYGFQLDQRCINSIEYPDLFWEPQVPIEETTLLFGNNLHGKRCAILEGLSQGGVYRRHPNYQDRTKKIYIGALKLCGLKVDHFLEQVKQRLSLYGFQSEVITRKPLSINNLSVAEARVEVEKAVHELIDMPHDIILTFLPQSDRQADDQDEGSFYHQIYSLLLRRQMASQMIYEDTLSKPDKYSYVLNQVIPGILAKLGNLPFVLAEPLEIADYFIGLDVSRASKKRQAGTINACASVILYGRQGEFVRTLGDDLIEGEEIPPRLLEQLLPLAELKNKTVLIYRDGSFVGKEVDCLVKRAKAIDSKFILVECRKSRIPRLYNWKEPDEQKVVKKEVTAPTQGLALRLSSCEAIVVTTKVSSKMGLARPLRLTVRQEGHPASIEQVVETTLKLTLLHYGALKEPRLPMPLYGSDSMAYLRLQGIRPSVMEGDRQFWL